MQSPREILDNSPMSMLQIIAVATCVLINALDGFDILAISFASPGIAEEWSIDRSALGIVLSMELIGMAVGSIALGGIADRYGRRPTILGCLLVMTAGMLSAALATDVFQLSFFRFITGLGIGGMLASVNAMVAEYANRRYRNLCIMILHGGYPLGIILGGLGSAELLKSYDWRAIFYFGAIVTACFFIMTLFLLPESVAYLVNQGKEDALKKVNKLLQRMNHAQVEKLIKPPVMLKSGLRSLLSPQFRIITLILVVAYFAHIMTHYFFLKWVPKIVVDMGYSASLAGSVLVWGNIGGLLSSILMGLLSQRFSTRGLTLIVLLACSASIVIYGAGADEIVYLSIKVAVVGFFTQASVVGLYALLVYYFPAEIRASGTGFVIGLGRGGAALGPIVAGLLFSLGLGLQLVAILMACGSLVAFFMLLVLFSKRHSGVEIS